MLSSRPAELTLGRFIVRDSRVRYDYAATSDQWAISNGLPHEIETVGGVRFCNILKTVAYVAVDETADGKPEIEKFDIRHEWQRDNFS